MDEAKLNYSNEEYPPHPAEPRAMPEPTFWPIVMGFGVVLTFWGLITSLIITGVGIIVMGISLAGWIQDLNHE
jgi:hypothetical protein